MNIALAGATGALGKELLDVLGRAPFSIDRFVPCASPATTEAEVQFGGKSHTVHDLCPEALDGIDLCFAAVPRGVGTELFRELADAGCIVVDLSSVFLADRQVPVLGLGLNSLERDSVREEGAVVAPGPLALMLAALGAPLLPHGLVGLRGTAIASSAIAGRDGMRELSGQVAALFNSQTPPRKVFSGGLAFDLLPSWGEEVGGWSRDELTSAAHAGRILGVDSARINVSMTVAPLFLGMALDLHLLTERAATAEHVAGLFREAPNIRLAERRELQPRACTGSAELAVGRIRDDRAGLGVHLWAACDPLRLTAANAVALVAEFVDSELI